jgi:zinc metalloprotease ZmpB
MKKILSIVFILTVSLSFYGQGDLQRKKAENWIDSQRSVLKINPKHEFKFQSERKSSSGQSIIRYQQAIGNVPVYGAEMVVNLSEENEVVYSSNSYDKTVAIIDVIPSISEQEAISIAGKSLGFKEINSQSSKLYVYNKLKEGTKLVYMVVTQAFDKSGLWEVIVDAKTSKVLSTKDISLKHHAIKNNKISKKKRALKSLSVAPLAFVKGSGMIYYPDPLSIKAVAYGGQYSDNNDATNASLNDARTKVELKEIDFTNGVYKLKNSYVEIKDLDNPKKGLFTQSTSDFSFTRDQDGFEAVNAFYHIDNSMRYINETLKIKCIPSTNKGIVWFDPSGQSGEDNSSYGGGELIFGEGGIDDAEDADVIWHELGHGIHDWLTDGNLSREEGLSEGSGDYWAQSHSRALKQWNSTNPGYQKVFNWDGNETFSGRTTAYDKKYPGGLVSSIHTSGQIWSTTLMKIWDVIGREKMDRAFLEGLALTNRNTDQNEAAIAVRQAAINMKYVCADVKAMTDKFTEVGYKMPALPFTIGCSKDQNVNASSNGKYKVIDYSNITSAISGKCDAVVTQSPSVGTELPIGKHIITMTAKSGGETKTCTFNLIVGAALGIDEVIKNNLKVYPNPASTQITISGDAIGELPITIYNIVGQIVLENTLKSTKNIIDISSLDKGVYMIKFNDTNVVTKFVKD